MATDDNTPVLDTSAIIDRSATKDQAQVPRVSATEQAQGRTSKAAPNADPADDSAQPTSYRAPSSKVERQELSDFNLWHTIAVREGLSVENDTINEKVRHAYKGEGKDKEEMGQWNYGESKGWLQTSEAQMQDRDVLTESKAKSGDLQAQERLVKETSDASSGAPRTAQSPSMLDLSRQSPRSTQAQA